MLVNDTTIVRNVAGLTTAQEREILIFLRGMVYAQCANAPDKWFSVRSFLGAVNFEWREIPLQALYEKYIARGKSHSEAIVSAGNDAGKLLKKVLANEPSRKFETKEEERIKQYKWLK